MENTIDCVRLQDVAHFCKSGDIIYLGMMYENRAMIENFCSGISWKKV